MVFINSTGTLGLIYYASVVNITGSEFLSLLGLIIMIMALFMIFGLPLELTAILVLPMVILFTAYSNNIFSLLGVLLLYLGFLLAKNWLIKS